MKRNDNDLAFLRANAATISVHSIGRTNDTFVERAEQIRERIEELLDTMQMKQASGEPEFYIHHGYRVDILEGLLRYYMKATVHRTPKVSENEILIVMPVSGSVHFGGVGRISFYGLLDDPSIIPIEQPKKKFWQRLFGSWND